MSKPMFKPHAYLNTPITYNPYQYKPLWELFQNNFNKNILISDEVGLGKTIEAGIIIDEFLSKDINSKILVVCPAFLKMKWFNELEDKFYITATIFDKAVSFDSESIVSILPVSKLKQFIDTEFKKSYDLIIVDEAHYFKNPSSARCTYLEEILSNSPKSLKVFMTATPINNTGNDYSTIRYLLSDEHLSTNTTKRQAYINLPFRKIDDVFVQLSPEEQAVYNVTHKLHPFSGTIYRHIGASCLYALTRYASKSSHLIKDELNSFLAELLDDDDETNENLTFDELEKLNLPMVDSKIDRLLKILSDLGEQKIVIFSHYIETVKYLHSQIEKEVKERGYPPKSSVAYVYANTASPNIPVVNKKNRFNDAKKWFEADNSPIKILICSDSCKEGVDLQISSALINYDLPFNPSILEQRIGRIDRLGQLNDMKIYNFHVTSTYDDRLHMILKTKLSIIQHFAQFGIGNPLNIKESNDTLLDRYLKYLDESYFYLSRDDVDTFGRFLRKAQLSNIPNNEDLYQNKQKLKQLLSNNRDFILDYFSNSYNVNEEDTSILLHKKEKLEAELNLGPRPQINIDPITYEQKK